MIFKKYIYLIYYSVKEFLLSKIFYIVFFFLIFSFFISAIVGIMAISEEKKVLSDFFAAACGMSILVFAIIYPPISMNTDIENKRIYLIISKSVSRFEWFISKYISYIISSIIICFFASFVIMIFVKVIKGYYLDFYYFEYILVTLLKILIILAISTSLSLITTSQYSTILITTMIWIISHFAFELKNSLFHIKSITQYFVYIVYLLPDFSSLKFEFNYIIYCILHSLAWIYLGVYFLDKKEL
ncbi:MAG: hypothetical protein N2Z20_01945 [Elusimicrobiales bacterium]|nr:hypothetical protein [Elusimicrobiales bacterium]